ncbi:MAG: Sir2 family NAD-dependent protein deacetylase [Actinomycetota bacterium]|nr:Sir2 family NAD-dependent protein deacetylase [Actinomycetota bacterium]
MESDLRHAARLLADRHRVLVFTGAGISTESGIPDFRGPQGIWKKVDPNEFTFQRYLREPEIRRKRWQMALASPLHGAVPNGAHLAVVELWRAGRLAGCVTQNIDGLHQAAGLPEQEVVEVHGTARRVGCLQCRAMWPTGEVLERVRAGEADPHCPHCGGILKTATISFGQMMPEREMERAMELAREADAVLSVGSTLSVYPAAWVPLEAADRGVPFVILNLGATEHDARADVKVEGPAGQVLPRLVAAITASK